MTVNSTKSTGLGQLQALNTKLETASMKIGDRGGRYVILDGKEVSINSIYKQLNAICTKHKKSFGSGENSLGKEILSKLSILDKQGNDLLDAKTPAIKKQTKRRQFFGNFFFNRSKAAKKMESIFDQKPRSASTTGTRSSGKSGSKKTAQYTAAQFNDLTGDQIRKLKPEQIVDYFNQGFMEARVKKVFEKIEAVINDDFSDANQLTALNQLFDTKFKTLEEAVKYPFSLNESQISGIDFSKLVVNSEERKATLLMLVHKDGAKKLSAKQLNDLIVLNPSISEFLNEPSQIQKIDFASPQLKQVMLERLPEGYEGMMAPQQIIDALNNGVTLYRLSATQLTALDLSKLKLDEEKVKSALSSSISNDEVSKLDRQAVVRLLPYISDFAMQYINEAAIDSADFKGKQEQVKRFFLRPLNAGPEQAEHMRAIQRKLADHLTPEIIEECLRSTFYYNEHIDTVFEKLKPEQLKGIDLTEIRVYDRTNVVARLKELQDKSV